MLEDLKDTESFSKEPTPAMLITKAMPLYMFKEDNGYIQAVVADSSDARLLTVYTTDKELERTYEQGRVIVLSNYKVQHIIINFSKCSIQILLI